MKTTSIKMLAAERRRPTENLTTSRTKLQLLIFLSFVAFCKISFTSP